MTIADFGVLGLRSRSSHDTSPKIRTERLDTMKDFHKNGNRMTAKAM